jgi:hypothetical protein
LALAGVRSGANVLDLVPAAGLGRAARAAAGAAGRVDEQRPTPSVAYAYVFAVSPERSAAEVVAELSAVRSTFAPWARATVGCRGPAPVLLARLEAAGWSVLHVATVVTAESAAQDEEVVLVLARLSELTSTRPAVPARSAADL